jgi:chromosomal replication initiation ATPase DnaA
MKKLPKSCQKVVKRCQKIVKKLSENKSKSCQKIRLYWPNKMKKNKLVKKYKTKIKNSENLQERYEEKRKTLVMMNARHP